MASPGLTTKLGPIELRTPLVAASGTVGSVWEWADTTDVSHYGAAVAKSVSPEPWPGRPVPRLAPTRAGMLNGVGIQNPGIAAWAEEMAPRLAVSDVPVWGSAVAGDAAGFAEVALGLQEAGVAAIEVNLSCPNLEGRSSIFAHDAALSATVIDEVAARCGRPVWAKLSPNTDRLVDVAGAVVEAGAEAVTLINTLLGMVIDPSLRRPALGNGGGGLSGAAIHPVAVRAVYDVHRALPNLAIVGVGGVVSGWDAAELMLAGACAVQVGTATFADPRAPWKVLAELERWVLAEGFSNFSEVIGAAV